MDNFELIKKKFNQKIMPIPAALKMALFKNYPKNSKTMSEIGTYYFEDIFCRI